MRLASPARPVQVPVWQEYVVMHHQSWEFGAARAGELKADLPDYGDVWARRVV
jgi:hypothetical protein